MGFSAAGLFANSDGRKYRHTVRIPQPGEGAWSDTGWESLLTRRLDGNRPGEGDEVRTGHLRLVNELATDALDLDGGGLELGISWLVNAIENGPVHSALFGLCVEGQSVRHCQLENRYQQLGLFLEERPKLLFYLVDDSHL